MVFRQMKIIANELKEPIENKFKIYVKLYYFMGKSLIQLGNNI